MLVLGIQESSTLVSKTSVLIYQLHRKECGE